MHIWIDWLVARFKRPASSSIEPPRLACAAAPAQTLAPSHLPPRAPAPGQLCGPELEQRACAGTAVAPHWQAGCRGGVLAAKPNDPVPAFAQPPSSGCIALAPASGAVAPAPQPAPAQPAHGRQTTAERSLVMLRPRHCTWEPLAVVLQCNTKLIGCWLTNTRLSRLRLQPPPPSPPSPPVGWGTPQRQCLNTQRLGLLSSAASVLTELMGAVDS